MLLSHKFLGIFVFDSYNELSLTGKLERIYLYAILILAAIIVIIGLLTKKFRKENLPQFFKYAIGIVIGFSIAVICSMFFFKINETVTEGYLVPILFYPILATAITGIVLIISGITVNLTAPEKFKAFSFIALGIFSIPVIASIVCLSIYYVNDIKDSYSNVSSIGLIISAIGLIALLLFLTFYFGKRQKTTTKSIVYAAVCIAFSFALSYIRIFRLPQGGSITLASILPLFFYSYMFGIRKGVLTGTIYGIMQAIQDPWIIHPAQFLLDYILAFGAIGLAGIFKEVKLFEKNVTLSITLGGISAVLIRYLCHAFSGMFAFASYGIAEGYSGVAWGFLYNAFVFPDLIIALIAGALMCRSKNFVKLLNANNVI